MMKETGTRVFSYHRNETGFNFIFQDFETGFKSSTAFPGMREREKE